MCAVAIHESSTTPAGQSRRQIGGKGRHPARPTIS
jgi:hypothetical protein